MQTFKKVGTLIPPLGLVSRFRPKKTGELCSKRCTMTFKILLQENTPQSGLNNKVNAFHLNVYEQNMLNNVPLE